MHQLNICICNHGKILEMELRRRERANKRFLDVVKKDVQFFGVVVEDP